MVKMFSYCLQNIYVYGQKQLNCMNWKTNENEEGTTKTSKCHWKENREKKTVTAWMDWATQQHRAMGIDVNNFISSFFLSPNSMWEESSEILIFLCCYYFATSYIFLVFSRFFFYALLFGLTCVLYLFFFCFVIFYFRFVMRILFGHSRVCCLVKGSNSIEWFELWFPKDTKHWIVLLCLVAFSHLKSAVMLKGMKILQYNYENAKI